MVYFYINYYRYVDISDTVTVYDYIGICPQSTFRCSNGNCISPLLTCDGEDNCGDRSDEITDHCHTGIIRCVKGFTLDIKTEML